MKALRMLVLLLLATALCAFAAPPATDCPPGSLDCPLEAPQTIEINPNPRTADGELAPVEEPDALTPVQAVIPMPAPTHVDIVPLPERAPFFETLDVGMRYQGEGDVSCGVQALGMALEGLGAPAPASSSLLNFLQQNGMFYDFGTGVEELAYAAQAHGYAGAYAFHNWDMEMLADELAAGRPVVVALGANGEGQPGHLVTVTGISPDGGWVAFNDPTLGQMRMPIDEFAALWALQGNSGVRVALDAPVTSAGDEMDLFPWVALAAGVMALVTQFPWGQRREGIGGALAKDVNGEHIQHAVPHTTVKDPPAPRRPAPPRGGNRPLTQPVRPLEPIEPPAPASPPRISDEASLVGGGVTEDEEGLLVHGVAQTGPAQEGMETGEETNPPAALLTGVMQDAGEVSSTPSTPSQPWGQEMEGILSLGIALGFLEEPISPPIDILDPPAQIPPSAKYDYDEKHPPEGITWDPFLQIPLALIVNSDGEFVSETNGAQYHVISGSHALCGQVALAAILRITYPWLTAEDVVRDYLREMTDIDPDPNWTLGSQLSTFVNRAYGDIWTAEVSGLRDLGGDEQSDLPRLIRQALADGTFIIALVGINSCGRVQETPGDSCSIPHWVVITGMSAQWDHDNQDSSMNWVRVFNPFDNQIEYYKWDDFAAAWADASKHYRMVLVSRI